MRKYDLTNRCRQIFVTSQNINESGRLEESGGNTPPRLTSTLDYSMAAQGTSRAEPGDPAVTGDAAPEDESCKPSRPSEKRNWNGWFKCDEALE